MRKTFLGSGSLRSTNARELPLKMIFCLGLISFDANRPFTTECLRKILGRVKVIFDGNLFALTILTMMSWLFLRIVEENEGDHRVRGILGLRGQYRGRRLRTAMISPIIRRTCFERNIAIQGFPNCVHVLDEGE